MKNLRIATAALMLLALPSVTLAQDDDWKTVKQIPYGSKIHVALKHGRVFGHCYLTQATDDELICETRTHLSPVPLHKARFRRDNIRAIYVAHSGPLIGLGVGAGAGAVLGAAREPTPGLGRGGTALLNAAILGGVGAFFGMVLDPFFHGHLIYLSPGHSSQPASSPASQQR
jgi:hypothetical protein